jgi:hypothetical protein
VALASWLVVFSSSFSRYIGPLYPQFWHMYFSGSSQMSHFVESLSFGLPHFGQYFMVVFLCFSFLSMLCMSFSIVMVLLPFGLL